MKDPLRDRFYGFDEAKKIQEKGLYAFFRPFNARQETIVKVNGKNVLMFGSNSYLGLTTHPKVIEASENALKKYGSSCSGSRFLNGTTDLHQQLESRLATFLGKEDALVFSTGYQVNLGTIPTITRKEDMIFLDRLNHASIYEGSKLSEASYVRFKHNDMASLEQKLSSCKAPGVKFIIVDGVFSMEGDIADLPGIVRLAKKYNAVVMSDCAHAVGVLGENGRGTANHFDLTDEVDLIGGTFSKSLASVGGFIAGNKETIHYLKHKSRALIFSASMTPSSTAAALASLDIIEKDDSIRQKLWENTSYALEQLKEIGFDTGNSETPIIPIYIRDDIKAYEFVHRLFDEGLFVNPVVSPAVSSSDSLIRFSLMATHTFDQIDKAISLMAKIAKEIGVPLRSKAA
ncbi:serine palmitoyltransferase [Ekhidna lutea]|uniref:Serine palmitoyltransferase n=1 Tax=Ekhidna lutea TaxID=447679 RepID=A0A239FRU2_EKHLU|nr:pyridoxal phosphate-dependent aminotransferase family protein [Ekhidna lutea]SNS59641.1 serine palmitoyltransferase [Ekhidna lutea]